MQRGQGCGNSGESSTHGPLVPFIRHCSTASDLQLRINNPHIVARPFFTPPRITLRHYEYDESPLTHTTLPTMRPSWELPPTCSTTNSPPNLETALQRPLLTPPRGLPHLHLLANIYQRPLTRQLRPSTAQSRIRQRLALQSSSFRLH